MYIDIRKLFLCLSLMVLMSVSFAAPYVEIIEPTLYQLYDVGDAIPVRFNYADSEVCQYRVDGRVAWLLNGCANIDNISEVMRILEVHVNLPVNYSNYIFTEGMHNIEVKGLKWVPEIFYNSTVDTDIGKMGFNGTFININNMVLGNIITNGSLYYWVAPNQSDVNPEIAQFNALAYDENWDYVEASSVYNILDGYDTVYNDSIGTLTHIMSFHSCLYEDDSYYCVFTNGTSGTFSLALFKFNWDWSLDSYSEIGVSSIPFQAGSPYISSGDEYFGVMFSTSGVGANFTLINKTDLTVAKRVSYVPSTPATTFFSGLSLSWTGDGWVGSYNIIDITVEPYTWNITVITFNSTLDEISQVNAVYHKMNELFNTKLALGNYVPEIGVDYRDGKIHILELDDTLYFIDEDYYSNQAVIETIIDPSDGSQDYNIVTSWGRRGEVQDRFAGMSYVIDNTAIAFGYGDIDETGNDTGEIIMYHAERSPEIASDSERYFIGTGRPQHPLFPVIMLLVIATVIFAILTMFMSGKVEITVKDVIIGVISLVVIVALIGTLLQQVVIIGSILA